MKSFLLILAMAGMACFTGCISVPKDMVVPGVELQQATLKFRLAEKHWPRDYDDLSGFLKRSHDPTYASLQAVKFHRLDFIALPDGGIKVYALHYRFRRRNAQYGFLDRKTYNL